MRHVEPKVTLLAFSAFDDFAAKEWLAEHGVSEEQQEILLHPRKTDAERVIEMAGRRCYKSFQPGLNPNVTKVRTEIADYLKNILEVGHGSVLEHVSFTFAIENVSRVFTGEMNRHRAGMAISEGSMRYIKFTDIPYWVPTCIRVTGDESVELTMKKRQTQDLFDAAFKAAETFYMQLDAIWSQELSPESKFKAKKEITSMMRRIIPMGVATGGIWTGNVRALRHICEMRCSPAAEEEILLVANQMLAILKEHEPNLFGDFKADADGFQRPEYKKV